LTPDPQAWRKKIPGHATGVGHAASSPARSKNVGIVGLVGGEGSGATGS
jgi:hypothetical protein